MSVSFRFFAISMSFSASETEAVSGVGTFVDENRVDGSVTLKLGQIIRVGSPGEKIQLIACLKGP